MSLSMRKYNEKSKFAITQEYIKSLIVAFENRNNTLRAKKLQGSMAFWRVSYAGEMERL